MLPFHFQFASTLASSTSLGRFNPGLIKLAEQFRDKLGRRHAVEARLIIQNQAVIQDRLRDRLSHPQNRRSAVRPQRMAARRLGDGNGRAR